MTAYPGPIPADFSAAYALQASAIEGFGEPVAGWKIGATNTKSQSVLGTHEPFYGPMFGSRIFENASTIEIAPQSLAIIEPEIAFKLGQDIPPREAAYTPEEIFAAVESIHPAFELIDRRLPGTISDGILWHIADFGLNDAFVYGPGKTDINLNQLADIAITASLNGKQIASGIGANALGGAHFSAQWLANRFSNQFSKLGQTLKKGQFLSTGLTTQVFTMAKGDRVEADFGILGTVTVNIK